MNTLLFSIREPICYRIPGMNISISDSVLLTSYSSLMLSFFKNDFLKKNFRSNKLEKENSALLSFWDNLRFFTRTKLNKR